MENNLNLFLDNQLDFYQIRENLINFEYILKKTDIIDNKYFKLWSKDFSTFYGNNKVQLSLYLYFSLVYFLGYMLIAKFILKKEKLLSERNYSKQDFLEIENEINHSYTNSNIFNIKYFKPILDLNQKELKHFCSIICDTLSYLQMTRIDPEFYFDFIIQNIIPNDIRHKTGEFYTPPFLARKMVNFSYTFGEKVLDPCCGSGNFLLIILKNVLKYTTSKEEKISAIKNLYGFDINPISIYMAKINFLLLFDGEYTNIKINLYNIDSLFPDSSFKRIKFELIIGNPPWYTLRDIDTIENQNLIKKLAEELEIKPSPKNLLNTEISTVFFYRSKEIYMTQNSKIFFIMTKGVITGSHTSRFRNFKGFNSIKIWKFNKIIEKMFRIDYICIFAKKTKDLSKRNNLEIPCYELSLINNNKTFNYFENIKLNREKIDNLIPYKTVYKGRKLYTKKLISIKKYNHLINLEESIYKDRFHKGADLNPRNLIFLTFENINNILVKINPDERVFKRAKYPWNNKEFKDEIVEQKNIFKAVKSTELIKFFIYDFYNVFLPVSKKDLSFNYEELNRNSQLFYSKINDIYLKLKKTTTKNNSLMDNLNRWGKLTNLRQIGNIKVIYNNSGSVLKSAVIQGDYIVAGDLSFYTTNNLDEAYYLSAILNSPLINEQIRIIKSSRHIFKKPFNFPIRKFNPQIKNHQKLASLAKEGELIAIDINKNLLKTGKGILKSKFQIELMNKILPILNEINKIVKSELSS